MLGNHKVVCKAKHRVRISRQKKSLILKETMAGLAGGALLSAVFNVLLERLAPEPQRADLLNFFRGRKLDSNLLHRLKPLLIAARAVLNDAELKQFADHEVKEWLDELKDAAYDLDDLMDEISTKAATQNQVCDFSSASPDLNMRDTDMADKLEAMTNRLQFLVSQTGVLGLKKSNRTDNLSRRPQSTSLVKVSDVSGRKKEKEEIMELLSDDGNKLSVIPIVGMGGIGKTTLAQLVYNDDYVKQEFHLRAWVCVSEAFDLLKITQTIIKGVAPGFVCDTMDLNLLQLMLEEKLAGKKFLVVLDDIWNEEYNDWDILLTPFNNGVEGSKILVTTCSERVASMVKTIPSFYRLSLLSNEDCLSLFARHAFHSMDSFANSCLEKFGKDIASKCKGLPLAAKALGGLFRSKPDVKYWNIILKDEIWDSTENKIIPALRISYFYLPQHLKQCFVYCSLFPEDYKFDKETLIFMWMGEGFLQPSKHGMTLEEVGYEYFDDLTSRSFFQHSSEQDGCFVMHDLIHQLATSIAGDLYFRLEKKGKEIGNRTRHLSWNFWACPCLDHLESLKQVKTLRTFICSGFSIIPHFVADASEFLSSNLKYLRVLSLCDVLTLKKIPDIIGEFIHLRYLDLSRNKIISVPNSILCNLYNLHYLDLSHTEIVSLPNSLCKLYNLQTLKLAGCHSLKMLPSDMQDLVHLRYLEIRNTGLDEMPKGLTKLKDLQFLSDFIVGKEQETKIGELRKFSSLKNEIFGIRKLENIKNDNEAYEAKMMERKHIKHLCLMWSCDDHIKDSQIERNIMDKLQPHWDLESLSIFGYRGTTFPDWLGYGSYHNMTDMWLTSCKNCWKLPSLGQLPALRRLHISELDKVMTIGIEFFKGDDCASMIPFASLESLCIQDMISWEEWHSIPMEAFPKLHSLDIMQCPKLTGALPSQLLSFETLCIYRCPLLSSSIPRCPKIRDIDIHNSQNVVSQKQDLPPSLRSLRISGSQMLEAVSENLHIQKLSLVDCSNALSLPVIHMPPSVKELTIKNCENLIFVSVSNTPLHNLQSISIVNCNYIPRSLFGDAERLLPNLKELCITRCPEIEPFSSGLLPSSLRELEIVNSEKLLSLHAEWHLPSITRLHIRNGHGIVKCYPEGCSLPFTLTTLIFCNFHSLETLNCKGLQHLTVLQELRITCCHFLEKIEGERLPASLKRLIVSYSDLLGKRLWKKDEEIWAKVSHIPVILINGVNVS